MDVLNILDILPKGIASLGFVFLMIGAVKLYKIKQKKTRCSSKTSGQVVDIVKMQEGNRLNSYPVFEYNVGGLKFTKRSDQGSFSSEYWIGQHVEVYYNPNDYSEYYVEGYAIPKTSAKTFTVIGAAIMAAAVVVAIFLAKMKAMF